MFLPIPSSETGQDSIRYNSSVQCVHFGIRTEFRLQVHAAFVILDVPLTSWRLSSAVDDNIYPFSRISKVMYVKFLYLLVNVATY